MPYWRATSSVPSHVALQEVGREVGCRAERGLHTNLSSGSQSSKSDNSIGKILPGLPKPPHLLPISSQLRTAKSLTLHPGTRKAPAGPNRCPIPRDPSSRVNLPRGVVSRGGFHLPGDNKGLLHNDKQQPGGGGPSRLSAGHHLRRGGDNEGEAEGGGEATEGAGEAGGLQGVPGEAEAEALCQVQPGRAGRAEEEGEEGQPVCSIHDQFAKADSQVQVKVEKMIWNENT